MRRLCRREWNWLWNWLCVNQHSWDPWQRTTWSRRVTSDFNSVLQLFYRYFESTGTQYVSVRIRTTPQEDNAPPYRFWSWRVVLFRGSAPSGELSWWGKVLWIVVLVGNGWALFLSGGELSSWGVVLEPFQSYPYVTTEIISGLLSFECQRKVPAQTKVKYPLFPSSLGKDNYSSR